MFSNIMDELTIKDTSVFYGFTNKVNKLLHLQLHSV